MSRLTLALLGGLGLLFPGCGATTTDYVPTELKERMPSLSTLGVSIPGKAAGAEDSASRVVHGHIAELQASLGPLSVLKGFFEDGGDRDRGVSIFVSLESPPHVADQVVRYSRGKARLDVESFGDHAFFYLQYDKGDGFAPDENVDASRMLVDGGSVTPKTYGMRPAASDASAINDPTVGFMRVHFNHRPGDGDAVNETVHFDYDTEYKRSADAEEVFTVRHFVFSRRPDVQPADGQVVAMTVVDTADWGWALRSERRGSGVVYSWIAIFLKDGTLGVWNNDGSLWACYDANGNELGNVDDPTPCEGFKRDIVSPPGDIGVWRGLPSGF